MRNVHGLFVDLDEHARQTFIESKLSDKNICRLAATGKCIQDVFCIVLMQRYLVARDLEMKHERHACSREADSIRDDRISLQRFVARMEKKAKRRNDALKSRETELEEKMKKLKTEGVQITKVGDMTGNDMVETVWGAQDNSSGVCFWD